VLVLLFSLFFGWLTFSVTDYSSALTDVLSRRIPGWLAMANWGLSLVLTAICMGPLAMPGYVRITFYALMLLSFVFLPVSLRTHPVVSLSILVLGYAEVYWLIPRWEAKWKREHEPQ
jgi:hypothetical protein